MPLEGIVFLSGLAKSAFLLAELRNINNAMRGI
jgi:hypothetical protein